mmetsp:Transcript_83497/g.239873  ORF Transcript_83497/g.239873 Transcript_83497/m.239873 type:complete len:210 (+) Transcript_83497:585-1214(+)
MQGCLLAEADRGPLGRDVRRRAITRLAADGGHVHHDAGGLGLLPQLQLLLHAVQGAVHIHLHLQALVVVLQPALIADLALNPRPRAEGAGVVHRHIQAAQLRDRLLRHLYHGARVRCVHCRPPQLGCGWTPGRRWQRNQVLPSLLRLLDVVADHHDGGALEVEGTDGSQADAAVAAGDNDLLARKSRAAPMLGDLGCVRKGSGGKQQQS